MVDLPEVPRRLALSEAPRSSLSRADVEAPYTSMARALGAGAQALEEVAEPLAERAAAEAVRTDEKGNVIVDRGVLPIVGRGGDKFEQNVRIAAVAKARPAIEEKLTELRLQHREDPRGFQVASDAYVDQLGGNQPDPVLRNAVTTIARQAASHAHRSLLVEFENRETANQAVAFKSEITALDNRLSALARQGGTDTPEYQQGRADLLTLYGRLQSNPRFKYPQERVTAELDEMTSRHMGEAVIGQAAQVLNKASPTAANDARNFLREAAWNPRLNLSPAQRDSIVARGMAALEGRTAETASAIKANQAVVKETLEGLKTSAEYDEKHVNDLIQRSAEVGDLDSHYRLVTAKALHPYRVGINAGTPQELMTRLARLRGEQTEAGLGQVNEENRQRLTSAGVAADPTNLYVARFFGADDAVKLAQADPTAPASQFVSPNVVAANKAMFDRNPTVGQVLTWAGNRARQPDAQGAAVAYFDAGRRDLIGDYVKKIDAALPGMISTFEKAIGSGQRPGPGELTAIADAIKITGRTDLVPRVEQAMRAAEASGRLNALPPEVRQAFRAQLAERAASGVSPAERAVAAQIEEGQRAVDQGMKNAPYRTAANPRQLIPAPDAYDFGNPAQVETVAKNRVAEQGVIRNVDKSGPISVFEGAEAASFATALTQGDPKAAGDMLARLNRSLPTDVFTATMTGKSVRDALTGMAHSYDPDRVTAAMTTLNRVAMSDPGVFARDAGSGGFGRDLQTRLQAWQALQSSFTPAEIAERFRDLDSPQSKARRDYLGNLANDELKDQATVKKITAAFDESILPFTGPSAPAADRQQAALVTEYRGIYRALREYGVSAAEAEKRTIERMKTIWAPSEIAGGQLMRYPPDLRTRDPNGQQKGAHYPLVNDSFDWMRKPLVDAIAEQTGLPEFADRIGGPAEKVRPGDVGRGGGPRNWEYRLAAVPETVADISAGRPPRYQVWVNVKGRGWDALPQLFRWDAKPAQEAAERDFTERRTARDIGLNTPLSVP